MKYLIILLFILSTFFANSCKKPVDPLPLDKDFLSYFTFPKGSWWVYKNAKSGLRDSFYVERYAKGIVEEEGFGTYEALNYDLTSKKNVKSNGQAIPQGSGHCTYQTDGSDGNNYRFSTLGYVKYINEIYQFSMKHLDSFQVNNIWYKDVYVSNGMLKTNQ